MTLLAYWLTVVSVAGLVVGASGTVVVAVLMLTGVVDE